MKKRIHIDYLFILLIIVFSLIAYWNTLSYGLIWDDYSIVESRAIRDFSLSSLFSFFIDREAYHAPGEIYRPLYLVSFAIDFLFHSTDAPGYHLTNVILHAIASVFVFFFVARLLEDKESGARGGESAWAGLPAFVAAILFAVHPVHTESVAWIKGRDDIICLIFMLASFLFYFRYSSERALRPWSYAASLLSFLFALFSKEMAVTLPLLLILVDFVKYPERLREKRKWLAYLPYFILLASFIALRTKVLGQVGQTEYMGGGFLPSFYSTANGFMVYLKILFVPMGQSADYLGFPVSMSMDLKVLSSLIVIALILAFAVWVYRYSRMVFFLIAFFFITLLPVSNFIPVKIYIAERFLYIPSISVALIAALIVRRAMQANFKGRGLRGLILIALVIIALYTAATIERNKVWASGRALWADVIGKYPTMRSYLNYGLSFEEEGDLNTALHYYKLSIESDPRHPFGYNNAGVIFLKKGAIDNAIKSFKKSLSLGSREPITHVNLATAYERKRMKNEAVRHYKLALGLDPGFVPAREKLAKIYMERGMVKEAQELLGY